MWDFLQNAWFVGITTGIISGVLVFFLTKWIMDRRGKVEYFKQVSNANNSVISALKPYIADRGLPNICIFKSIVSSTSRKFGINEKDMFSVSVYCEELINEIIGDVYVSNEKKCEYTNALAEYKKIIEDEKLETDTNGKTVTNDSSGLYGERIRRQISVYMAALTAILGMCVSLLMIYHTEKSETISFWYPFEENPVIWIPIMMIFAIIVITIFVTTMEMFKKVLKQYKEHKKNN